MIDPGESGTITSIHGKPGEIICGRGVDEALDVIQELEKAGIPCCVTGAKALVYYGAHRVPEVSCIVVLFGIHLCPLIDM
jgi:hypothetical protein